MRQKVMASKKLGDSIKIDCFHKAAKVVRYQLLYM